MVIMQTQFLSAVTGTVLYPHLYEDGIQNRVVALTKVLLFCIEYSLVYVNNFNGDIHSCYIRRTAIVHIYTVSICLDIFTEKKQCITCHLFCKVKDEKLKYTNVDTSHQCSTMAVISHDWLINK